eukprot:TRINITY_DN13778_c0_g1_i1.p1 TRINITY_DN13778_c0_g1~~TRINITY_DN13778_c0_g1_i1.p1  ORF type:complete len:557 (+),score=102.80 TRINITY_DN13778_c0_g1_i1:111-1781(+)
MRKDIGCVLLFCVCLIALVDSSLEKYPPTGTIVSLPALAAREPKNVDLNDFQVPTLAPYTYLWFPINVSVKSGDAIYLGRKNQKNSFNYLDIYIHSSLDSFLSSWTRPPSGYSLFWTAPFQNKVFGINVNAVTFNKGVILQPGQKTGAVMVIFNNGLNSATNFDSLMWEPNPPTSVVIAALIVGAFVLLYLVIHAVLLCCKRRQSRKHQMLNWRGKELDVPYYLYVGPPKPIFSCLTTPLANITNRFFTKPIHGFRIHYLNSNEIFWVWWPHHEETSGAHWRSFISFYFITLSFIFQTFWAQKLIASLPIASSEEGSGIFSKAMIINFVIIDLSMSVVKNFGRPFLRNVDFRADRRIWGTAENPTKRKAGIAICGLTLLLILFTFAMGTWTIFGFIIENDASSFQLVTWTFFGMLLWRSIIKGIPIQYLMYRICGSYGREPEATYFRVDHQYPSGPTQPIVQQPQVYGGQQQGPYGGGAGYGSIAPSYQPHTSHYSHPAPYQPHPTQSYHPPPAGYPQHQQPHPNPAPYYGGNPAPITNIQTVDPQPQSKLSSSVD